MAEPRAPIARSAPGRGPVAMPPEDEVRRLVRRVVEAVAGSVPGEPTVPRERAQPPGLAPTSSIPGTSAASPRPAPGRVSIAVGSDHGGFALKERLGRVLAEQGYDVHDCGPAGPDAVDYPDFAHVVARLVADGTCTWGIMVDGAGIGSCMVANKVPGVRAALCYDLSSARNSREHNHANVLTLGARLIGEGLALDIVSTWLETPWGPGRHAARVDKITDIERRYLRDRLGDGTR
jgi:ribose 5-phosphate isomerase B